ncbi:Ig-like domain-containing protein [Spongiibacter tropicus]
MTLEYDNLFNLRKKTTTNPSSSIFYNYGSNNRLSSISGAQARSFQYDQRGNVISNGLRVFSYDPLSRMINSGNSLYYYDGNDKIVSTVDSSGETISIYSKNGNLISQFFPDGSETNYIRLNNLLIAKNTIGNGSENAPIALDDEWTIERCEDFTFNPTINDSDVDGDEISIVSVDNPDITIINDTTLYYGGNCSRIDVHFNYTISDEAGNTATAHVFIDIDD